MTINDYLGKFHHDRTLFSRALEIMVSKGNHPQMAELFIYSDMVILRTFKMILSREWDFINKNLVI